MPEQQPPHPQRFPPPAYAAHPVYPVYGAPSHYPCYPPHYGAPPLPGSAHHHIRYEYLNPHRDTTDTTPTGEATKESESRQEESTREIPITTSTKEARVPTNPDSLQKDPAEKEFTETASNPPSSTVTTIATSGVPQGPKNPQISTLTMHYPPTSSTAPHPGWYHQQQLSYHHHHPHAPAPYSAVMHKGIPLPPPVPAGYPVAYPPHHHTHNPTGVSYVVYPATMSHPPQPTSTNNHIQPSVSSETTSSTSHHQEHHSSFLKPSDSNDLPKQDTALPTPGNAPKSTTITSEDISVGQDESSENVSQKGIASNQDTSATVSSSSFSSAPAEELSSNSQVQSTMPEAADALLSLAMLRYTPSHTAPPAPTTTSKDSQGSHHEDSTSRSVKRKAEDSCMADEATTVGHRTVKQSKTAGHDTQGSRNHHHHSSSTRVTLPYQKHHSPESHKVAVHGVSQRSLSMEEEEGSICTCKKSRCLKLYCDCLGAGTFCSSRCKCLDCGNIPGSKDLLAAAESIKKKMQESKTLKKSRGVVTCKCSKSGCLKKYCEVSIQYICWRNSPFMLVVSPRLFLVTLTVFQGRAFLRSRLCLSRL